MSKERMARLYDCKSANLRKNKWLPAARHGIGISHVTCTALCSLLEALSWGVGRAWLECPTNSRSIGAWRVAQCRESPGLTSSNHLPGLLCLRFFAYQDYCGMSVSKWYAVRGQFPEAGALTLAERSSWQSRIRVAKRRKKRKRPSQMGIMASICMHSFMACSLSRNHVLDALGLRNVSLRHSFNIIWQYGHIL